MIRAPLELSRRICSCAFATLPGMRRSSLLLFPLLAATACATAPPAPVPSHQVTAPLAPPRPALTTTADIAAVAAILRLSDRREFNQPVLESYIHSTNEQVRIQAARAVARMQEPRSVHMLIAALQDSSA